MKPGIRKTMLAVAAVFLANVGTVQADPVGLPFFEGEIVFFGVNVDLSTFSEMSAEPDGGTGIGDSTGIQFTSENIDVALAAGDFAGVVAGTPVTFSDIIFGATSPANPLWVIDVIVDSLAVSYAFHADSITVTQQDNRFLTVSADGMISATGYEDTAANWAFALSQSGGPNLQSWTANTTTVPEPGTLALFSLGLLGVGIARRRRVVRA